MSTVMNLRVPKMRGISRPAAEPVSFSRRTLLHGVSKYMLIMLQVSPHGRKSHSRYFILFSDMLMYCKVRCCPLTEPNSLRCCCILPLKKCTVDEILSKGMFKVTCQNEVLILCSATAEEGDAWISALRKAVKQVSYCTAILMVRSWCVQTDCSEIRIFNF